MIKTIFFILVVHSMLLYAQNIPDEPIRFQVDYRIRPLAEPGYGQLDITIKIPNRSILFKKKEDIFEARIDVTISIMHDGKKIAGDTWFEMIIKESYQETIASNQFIELKKSYNLEAEDVNVIIYVTDIFTQRMDKKEFVAKLSMFKDVAWSLGNVTYLNEPLQIDSSKTPPVKYIRFVFSAAGKEGKEKFTYRIFDDGEKIREGYFYVDLKKEPQDYIFPISINNLGYKEYTLELSTFINDVEVKRSTRFQVRWQNMPPLIHDLDVAIRQMRYLRMTNFISVEEYETMLKAEGEEQKRLFQEFWKKHDPTPTTLENELMNEYFHRIQLANQMFSGFQQGWETDRGMIYIIFGEPDDVEIHSFELSTKPYIIWYYHSLNRQFLFVDYTGFGDYQLADPVFDLTY